MIFGAAHASGDAMRTWPRDAGRRLHTDAVNAGKSCSGSPKRSSDSGCTWYSRLACASAGRLFVNAPSCDGAMLIGPARRSAYCRPIRAFPHQLLASVFSVRVPETP